MSDALVARIEEALAVADQEEQLSFCVSERYENVTAASIECDDLRALLTAYATVQAERDAAMADAFDSAQKMGALHIELATLRETLVGELEAERIEGSPDETESWLASTWNTALDCAINVIKGTK